MRLPRVSHTSLKKDTLRQLAEERLREISLSQGKGSQSFRPTEVDRFIYDHFPELQKDTDKILDDLCKEIIPESRLFYLLKQFGILSIFLVPPLYPLGAYITRMWTEFTADQGNLTALVEAASGIVGSVLLLCVLVCSVKASFFNK